MAKLPADIIDRERISLNKIVGEIQGALAEIRWTNRLIIAAFLIFALEEWGWPLWGG